MSDLAVSSGGRTFSVILFGKKKKKDHSTLNLGPFRFDILFTTVVCMTSSGIFLRPARSTKFLSFEFSLLG
jgi:hypothetical protein